MGRGGGFSVYTASKGGAELDTDRDRTSGESTAPAPPLPAPRRALHATAPGCHAPAACPGTAVPPGGTLGRAGPAVSAAAVPSESLGPCAASTPARPEVWLTGRRRLGGGVTVRVQLHAVTVHTRLDVGVTDRCQLNGVVRRTHLSGVTIRPRLNGMTDLA